MTHTSTEQERAEFHEWKLRDNPKYNQTDDSMQDRRDWLVWQAARRAQVVHVNLSQADSEKMIELVQSGNYQIVQDDAAPVQMPEPEAWRYTTTQRRSYAYRGKRKDFDKEHPILKPEPLYTEQQVRQLLAAHDVK